MSSRRRLLVAVTLAVLCASCTDDGSGAATTTTEDATTTSTSTTTTLVPRAVGSTVPVTEPEEPDTVPLVDLVVGDCVNFPGFPDPEIVEIERASPQECDLPHDAQIYGQLPVAEDPAAPYPGDDAVISLADAACLAEFETYVGRRYVDTRYEIVHLRPNEAAWVRGEATVVCAVVNSSFEPLVGSLQDEGVE